MTTTDPTPILRSPGTHRWRSLPALLVPLVLVCVVALVGSSFGSAISGKVEVALVNLVIVVGLQIFLGNSGVLSFGHIAFVAVGAWTFGLLTVNPTLKQALIPDLFGFLVSAQAPPYIAALMAGLVGALLALLVGPVLLRLNGLQAGIATFALLGVVNQVLTYWKKIGPPGGQSLAGVPTDFPMTTLLLIALTAITVSWLYQRTRTARLLRASRESLMAAPASGIHVTWHRLVAFVLSGAVCGVGGAIWAETNHVLQASAFYLQLTFTIIAMLVLGGLFSLWGAVVGTIVYSVIDVGLQYLQTATSAVTIPESVRPLVLGAILVTMLIFRPDGLTGGREFSLPRRGRARR